MVEALFPWTVLVAKSSSEGTLQTKERMVSACVMAERPVSVHKA